MLRKAAAIISALALVFGMASAVRAEEIELYIDGTRIECDAPPIIVEDRTLISVRTVSEHIPGMTVSWSKSEQSIKVYNKEEPFITLWIGDSYPYIFGEGYVTIDVEPQIHNDRTMVPLRFIAETFGCSVDWDEENQEVSISTGTADKYTETKAGETVAEAVREKGELPKDADISVKLTGEKYIHGEKCYFFNAYYDLASGDKKYEGSYRIGAVTGTITGL